MGDLEAADARLGSVIFNASLVVVMHGYKVGILN